MKISVLGIGKTGQAMACYLLSKNQDVTIWDRKQQKVDIINQSGITVSGVIDGIYRPKATADIKEAIKGAKYIFVMTVANGHRPVAELLSGNLEPGQRIVIFNGNWGALEFYDVLQKETKKNNILISETGGMLLLANSSKTGECLLKQVKKEISLAAIPKASVNTIIDELKPIFDQFAAADNVVETSLNNSNPVMHTPITLFNITRLENGEDYSFYGDAATRLTLSYVVNADNERVAVAKALGINAQTCLEIINSFWTDKYDNLYDAMKNNKGYVAGKGPQTLDYRYITEDVPFGIGPIIILGKKYGVPTPYLDTLIGAYSMLLGRDMLADVPDFDRLNLSEIINL